MNFEETKNVISLHGLGFIQVKLQGHQRIHVWHPDLPKRKCFEHSSIHTHRFAFVSRVLVGKQINQIYTVSSLKQFRDVTHTAYLHEGDRSKFGGRPWVSDIDVSVTRHQVPRIILPGQEYRMGAYEFHSTDCDGIVVTLMEKISEGTKGAHSLCKIGVEPDADFDRFQISEDDLWSVFNNAMKGV